MKTKLHLRKLATLFVVVLGIFISSCTKEEPALLSEAESSSNLMLKNGTIAQGADLVECDLIGGQHINVGKVITSHDAVNIYVTYLTSGGWVLSELHLYVGTLAGLPQNNGGGIQIGHFPYSAKNLIGITTYTFEIPIADVSKDANGYTIAAHAVVINGKKNETAWSNCTCQPIITVKSLMRNADETHSYAVSSGIPYNNLSWCQFLGTNIYEKDDEYTLKKLFSLVNVGTINVTDDGTNLLITVAANAGSKLLDTYLYVGTMNGLANFEQDPPEDCLNYTAFPYQAHLESDTHAFSIPNKLNCSLSFKDALGSNRWGWLYYYNF